MPITVSPTDYATRWVNGLSGASQKIIEGVNATTQAPSAAAIKAQQKMLTNFTNAVTSGKWATNIGKITLQNWKDAMINKGVPRIASGASAAQSKMQAFASQLIPYEQGLQTKVLAMPNLTATDAKARMNAWFDGMIAFKPK